jgi:hypothetical protein
MVGVGDWGSPEVNLYILELIGYPSSAAGNEKPRPSGKQTQHYCASQGV